MAVTGAAGYLGGRLVERLQNCDTIEYILATDIVTPNSTYNDQV